MWEAKYSARARVKGWYGVMMGTTPVPDASTALDPAVAAQATLLEARKANNDGYADILLSMEDVTAFNVVDEAKTAELPDGSLAKAYKDLKVKYGATTKTELVDLKREFATLTLESGEDPEDYLTELEAINRKICGIDVARAISDEDVLIQAMAMLPDEYDHLIPGWSSQIGATTNALTMEKLKEELRAVYKRHKKRKNSDEPKALVASEESALAAVE